MATMKVKRTKTVTEIVSITFPDWYPCDDTKVGMTVDVMLKDLEYVSDPCEMRASLYNDDADIVEQVKNTLDKYYKVAQKIADIGGWRQ